MSDKILIVFRTIVRSLLGRNLAGIWDFMGIGRWGTPLVWVVDQNMRKSVESSLRSLEGENPLRTVVGCALWVRPRYQIGVRHDRKGARLSFRGACPEMFLFRITKRDLIS